MVTMGAIGGCSEICCCDLTANPVIQPRRADNSQTGFDQSFRPSRQLVRRDTLRHARSETVRDGGQADMTVPPAIRESVEMGWIESAQLLGNRKKAPLVMQLPVASSPLQSVT
jgi:hypothetical protein